MVQLAPQLHRPLGEAATNVQLSWGDAGGYPLPMFNGYFLVVGMAGLIAVVLFAAAGRPVLAVGAIAIAGVAIAVRGWLLQRMDAGVQARDAGAPLAVRSFASCMCRAC